MSESVSYRCDICGVEKQKTNHWWKGYMIDAGELNTDKALAEIPAGFMVIPWDTESFSTPFRLLALTKPDAHLCGEQHAIEWASKNLTKKATREAEA